MYSGYGCTSNGTNAVLGHMLTIDNETKTSWKKFLEGLKKAHTLPVEFYSYLDRPGTVFIMDKFARLWEQFIATFDNATPFWCSFHRYDNLSKKSRTIAKAYQAAVNATLTEKVDNILDKLTPEQRDWIVWNNSNQKKTAVPKHEQFPAYTKHYAKEKYDVEIMMMGQSTTQVRICLERNVLVKVFVVPVMFCFLEVHF